MNTVIIKSKKVLAGISGILFVGLLVNSFAQAIPVNFVQAQSNNEIGTLSISTSMEMEEKVFSKTPNIDYIPPYAPDSKKVENIREYLVSRHAPLADYAEEFVKAADEYDIDYRIVAAISVIESGGGKNNFRKHNAWGWGKRSFDSWEDGIWAVSMGISNYYSRGLTTPKLISTYYCPPNAAKWANNVQHVMDLIANM